MRPMGSLLAGLAVFPLLAAPALAGVFGGFSEDGSAYLKGRDQICRPIAPGPDAKAPSCRAARPDEIARARFRPGRLERGPRASYRARATGTAIALYEAGGEEVARFEARGPVSSVGQVSSRAEHQLVAVEFQTRLGRRVVEEVVVWRLPGSSAPVAGAPAAEDPAGPAADPPPPTADDPKRAAARDQAAALARRKRWREAAEAFERFLVSYPDDPEGRFHLAGCLAALGRRDDAIAALRVLAASPHPEAPVWLVEARSHGYFSKIRTDADYRRAVGLVRDPARTPSAYERVVGLGGRWEQAAVPCEEPRVNLELDRKKRTFSLRIQSRCQGAGNTTRLSGTWEIAGASELRLVFPNPGADNEALACRIEVCRDGSGEDCIRCSPDPDLEFLLRAVRR